MMSKTRLVLVAMLVLGLSAATLSAKEPAAEKAAEIDLQLLLDAIRSNRKALVASNLNLTDEQAVKFWPVYERYRKQADAVGDRLVAVIQDYTSR